MNTSRTYQGKDVDMLTACATIVENAIARQQFLSAKRSNWTSNFFEQLKNRIDNAFVNFLGISSATELRNATQAVNQIQVEAMSDLTEIKTQIDADYQQDKKRRDEILKQLGYTDFFKKSRTKDQEALIQLLFTYNNALTPQLTAELTEKGIMQTILIRVKDYAKSLSDANINQETLKGSRKTITETALVEFNAIYNDVIAIAKIARNFYKGNPVTQDEFSYAKVRRNLNATQKKAVNPEQ